jgi:gliding motility-associated-like protein
MILNKYIVILLLLLSVDVSAQSGCPPLAATNDTIICGTSIQLNTTPGFSSYSWSPATGLSNPSIPNPVATVTSSTTYTVTGTTAGANLFLNGDFSGGNVGFSSGYGFTTSYAPCNYYVGAIWFGSYYPTFTDHTSTTDNMFMHVDGCTAPGIILWEQTITGLLPSTLYDFSFWASRSDVIQPTFEMHFIGNVTGDNIVNTTAGVPYTGFWTWDSYGFTGWNSTVDNSVTVRVINLATPGYGNDFGLDDFDIHSPACAVSDTVTITYSPAPAPIVSDTNVCLLSTPGALNATGQNLLWYSSPGSMGSSIMPVPSTITPGITIYYVTQTINSCESDPVSLSVNVIALVDFDLGPNTTKCKDQSIEIGPGNVDWTYLWADGSVLSPKTISEEGLYVLTATNECGNHTDSIKIADEDCECRFYLPNAFTPNGNGRNEIFKPVYFCDFSSYKMEIFDRWGELIFETQDATHGWDGIYKGQLVEQAVYTVKVFFKETNGAYADERLYLDKVVVVR